MRKEPPRPVGTWVNLPKVPYGMTRDWLKCWQCGRVQYRDHKPGPLYEEARTGKVRRSDPPLINLLCGHDEAAAYHHHALVISAREAEDYFHLLDRLKMDAPSTNDQEYLEQLINGTVQV